MLLSTYRQYKEDTKAFTTWLGGAAQLCGYKQGPRNMSTKPDRHATATVRHKYAVTTLDIELQIEHVSTSDPKILMPAGIKMTLQRAIAARGRYTKFHEATRSPDTAADEDGHRQFVDILQDALVRLGTADPTPSRANMTRKKEVSADKDTIAQVE